PWHVALEGQVPRQIDSRKEPVVPASEPDLLKPVWPVAPKCNLVLIGLEQTCQSTSPRTGPQHGDLHGDDFRASATLLQTNRLSVPCMSRCRLVLCLAMARTAIAAVARIRLGLLPVNQVAKGRLMEAATEASDTNRVNAKTTIQTHRMMSNDQGTN